MGDSHRVLVVALRDFLLAISGLSGLFGPFVYFLPRSDVPEPLRTTTTFFLIGGWIAGGVSLGLILKRDLTTVALGETGVWIGRRTVPFGAVDSVDPRPGKTLFRLKLRDWARMLHVSKFGIEDEEDFFRKLSERVRRGG